MAKVFTFAIKGKQKIIGIVFIFNRVDKISKACEQSCGKTFRVFELWEGVVISKKKAKSIYDG